MGRRFARRPGGPPTLRLLLALLAVLVAAIAIRGQLEGSRRTAVAPIEITRLDYQAGEAYRALPRGWNVGYQFTVEGRTYEGAAFRSWSLAAIRAAKVCHDPEDPRNEVLVRAGDSCR